MKKTLIILISLFCSGSAASAQTDPQLAEYLNGLNRYYYCLTREGLKSFQCQATASFSGELPAGYKKDLETFNWQSSRCGFDFSYLGGEALPILAFSSNGGDLGATPAKLRNITNLANALLIIWGSFSTLPLFGPSDTSHVYSLTRGTDPFSTITDRSKGTTVIMDFDEKGMAKRLVTLNHKENQEIKLWFSPMPQGVVLHQAEMDIHLGGGKRVVVDIFVEYQNIQGFLLPTSFTLFERTSGQLFKAIFQMSNYQVRRYGDIASADGGDTQIVTAASEAPGAKHFLWRARSNSATVYLLGSIHVRPDVPLQLPEIVEKSFEASNYVGFECDLTKMDEMEKETMGYLDKNCAYPPGDSLIQHLTPKEWEKVRVILKHFHVPEALAVRYKPYALDNLFTEHFAEEHAKTHKNGIDFIFLRKAQAANKAIFGLEFWWEPLKQLDTLDDHEQAHYLLGSDKNAHNHIRFLDQIFADWRTGNTTDLDSLINLDLSPDDKVIMDKIIKSRNEVWLGQLDRMFQTQGTYFIIVGSGHLVGQFGLPNWLRSKGYSVEQL